MGININEAIREISSRNIFETQALIVYNKSKTVLMMPVGASTDGKKYKIWNNLPNAKEAIKVASEFGSRMGSIDFKTEIVEDIPEDPEILMCNHFLLKFY